MCSSDLFEYDSSYNDIINNSAFYTYLGIYLDDGSNFNRINGNNVSFADMGILIEQSGNTTKIGRASCRERVEISVVAGSVKKKRKEERRERTEVWKVQSRR